jgi:hypothetical protein
MGLPTQTGNPRSLENKMNEFLRSHGRSGSRAAVLLSVGLIASACASTPVAPTASLGAARSAIADAEKVDAGRYASVELSEAREKLAAAQSAVEQKKMPAAQRLAEQSRVEAQLALAKSGEAKNTAVNEEMKQSNGVLLEEMQRKTGGQP